MEIPPLGQDIIKYPMGAMETQDRSIEGMGISIPVPSSNTPKNDGDNPSIPDAASMFGKGPEVRKTYVAPKSGDPFTGKGKM